MSAKKLFPFIAAFLLVSIPVFAHEESEEGETVEISAGVLPTSIFYSLDTFAERISLWTTFSQEEKVDKLFQNANERIAEIRELIEGSKASKAQKAAKLQAEAISQAASFMSIYDSGPVTEQFLFREGFIASLQLHAIEIAELADYYPEKITAKERLANDFLIDSLVKPVENLNKDLVNKGWEGITEKSTDEAISRAESLLAQTRGNSFFTKKHYDDMDSEMAQAKSENKKGNFVEAKSLANSLAVHIGEEMLISQIPESSG